MARSVEFVVHNCSRRRKKCLSSGDCDNSSTNHPFDRFSTFTKLKWITAWVLRFVKNAHPSSTSESCPHLTVTELISAENYWISIVQEECFAEEVELLKTGLPLAKNNRFLPLRPFLDKPLALLRVGGRMSHFKLAYTKMHPVILHGSHPLTRLIVRGEHVRLMHAGPTLMMSSQYHIIGLRKMVRSITRQCTTCRRHAVKPTSQLLGQLPTERVTPGSVFTRVGVDYAGPFQIKYGYVKKPTILKAYICLFVCLAVYLELVSDLTTEAFIAALRRFTARRGHPQLIWE